MRAESASESRDRTLASTTTGLLLFLSTLALYIASGPGRIDMIDGQVRYDVAWSWLETGHPLLRDPALARYRLRGLQGYYSPYNAGASVAGMPLLWIAEILGGGGELRRAAFSFTSAFFGAALTLLFFLQLKAIGHKHSRAVAWSLVLAFCTYLWPLATSTFDQAQHALFVALGYFLAIRAARTESALAAFAAGLCVGALIQYQENYILLAPGLALPLLWKRSLAGGRRGRDWIRSLRLLFYFGGAVAIGLAAWFEYNRWRFGVAYVPNRFGAGVTHPPLLGNPIIGLTSLLFSPGKSVFLYSPVLILGLLGWTRFRRLHPAGAWPLLTLTLTQVIFVSSLTFFGSDWSWGPRYLLPVLPLWILPAAEFSRYAASRRRVVVVTLVIAVGLLVQLLGISLDHHRFFYSRKLPSYFWYSDPWFYFRHSALMSRPCEIFESFEDERAREAALFAPSPYPDAVTYCVFGMVDARRADQWMRSFRIFAVPRPWPLWSRSLPTGTRYPINPRWGSLVAGVGVAGIFCLGVSGRKRKDAAGR